MQCEEIREQFADYVINRVPEPVRLEFEEHLESCAECRAELAELKTMWTQLGKIPAVEPSDGMHARFNLMLQAYQDGHERHPRKWHWAIPRFAAAAAVLVLGIAIGYRMHAPAAPNSDIAELRNELSATRQMVALSLMQQESATDRLKGVNWSYRLQEPGTDVLRALLDTLMHDSNVNVRLATVDALKQFGSQPLVRKGIVQAMAQQESPMVQIALIDLAVDLHEKESVNTLRELTMNQEADPAVRDRAQRGLLELE